MSLEEEGIQFSSLYPLIATICQGSRENIFYIGVVNWLLELIMENSERPSTTAVL